MGFEPTPVSHSLPPDNHHSDVTESFKGHFHGNSGRLVASYIIRAWVQIPLRDECGVRQLAIIKFPSWVILVQPCEFNGRLI